MATQEIAPQTQPPASNALASVEFRPLVTTADKAAFRALNEEWISRYFVLEPKDIETLTNPDATILDKGGHIYIADHDGHAIGCVALIPMGNGVYELSKMAVSPVIRGQGIGRRLLEYTIAQARDLGAKSLFLGSNSRLANAVHLYESLGFRHVPPEELPEMHYARADVFMQMAL
ncbi:MAG TPA: GNAT family N-acetyltransferase [Acidobacteriaceae bacterium]